MNLTPLPIGYVALRKLSTPSFSELMFQEFISYPLWKVHNYIFKHCFSLILSIFYLNDRIFSFYAIGLLMLPSYVLSLDSL